MISLAQRTLILAAAFFLALPPGWCGVMAELRAAQPLAAESCCRHARELPTPVNDRSLPNVACCCQRDLVKSEHEVQLDGPTVTDQLPAADAWAEIPADPQTTPLPTTATKRHVLLCQWRC